MQEYPIEFIEVLGENTISKEVRNAFIWACIKKFVIKYESMNLKGFSEKEKALSKHVILNGPYESEEQAIEDSIDRMGILCLPVYLWTQTQKPLWLCTLAH